MGLMHIVWMIVIGFIVGVVARFVYPGAIDLGFWATSIVGIVGSLVGGVIGGLVWRSADGKFHPAGFILSVVGALIVLWLYLNFIATR
ncbi:MAG: GlsB/YeaQ/YmgE family stress response membrane protein [Rudaea sp.]